MAITIDKAGRVVIPKHLRDELGLRDGMALSVTSDGVGLRIEPMATGGRVVEQNGRLVVESSTGRIITDSEITEAIDAGRR
jgi:AbrB family looped-hinge helix DNA binding protein